MLKSDSCCYTCLLPQLLCNKNDHTCEFKNVVLEFNFVIAILVQSKDSINAIKLIKEFNL